MYPQPAAIPTAMPASPWRSRIIYLIILMHLAVLAACVLSSNTPPASIAPVLVGVLTSCLATLIVFFFSESAILQVLAIFLALNYTGKLVYVINFPENTYLPILDKEARELTAIICEKYLLFTVSFLAFSLAAVFTSKIAKVIFQNREERIVQYRVSGFAAVAITCYCLLALRAFLLLYMKIGAPGVVAVQLGIPYLTGILNFLASKGTLLFVSGLVAMALWKKSPSALMFSLFTALLYVVIDVLGGWRGPLFRMPFCILWLFLAMESSSFKAKLKPILLTTILIPPLLFVPILQYRHMIRKGLQPLEAARASFSFQDVTVKDLSADVGKILNRIIGLDMYVIASHATEERPLGVRRALDPSVGSYFTNEVMGVPEAAITAYACSYWGFWAMLVGDEWLWTGGVLFGIAVGVLSMLFLARSKLHFVKTVIACNLTIYFINFLMANGAIVLYAKEVLMLLLGCILFNWLAYNRANNAQPQYLYTNLKGQPTL